MARSKSVFRRVEKKYIVNDEQLHSIMPELMKYMREDEYGISTVCSLYFDTPDRRLIRTSMEKPVYKEKLRLRCYRVPNDDSEVFLELKKKYKGIVYKRRVAMTYSQAMRFVRCTECPDNSNQILKEITWTLKYYGNLEPSMALFCERFALRGNDDDNLRITFDKRLRYRTHDLELSKGSHGELLLPADKYIMEIKTAFSMPLWLTKLLDENNIYPVSFSKYGTAYRLEEGTNKQNYGGKHCV